MYREREREKERERREREAISHQRKLIVTRPKQFKGMKMILFVFGRNNFFFCRKEVLQVLKKHASLTSRFRGTEKPAYVC